MKGIKKVTDAVDLYLARKIQRTGLDDLSEYINELKEAGVFDDRKNYIRVRQKIQEKATKANISISDELINELDDDIKNLGAYV